jgi:hypothetical protein
MAGTARYHDLHLSNYARAWQAVLNQAAMLADISNNSTDLLR